MSDEPKDYISYSACDAETMILKDLQQHMSHPFFSLSKRPCYRTIKYENGENWIKILPSASGRVTIYDKDILVYIISQLIQKERNKEKISRHVKINPSALLKAINRGTGGTEYKGLEEALNRLVGTMIQTNIVQGGIVETKAYGMIDTYHIKRENNDIDGRMLECSISLSDQLFDSMMTKKELLTINPDYFKLKKPLEKKIYEIARRHTGRKSSQVINTETLLKRSGSVGNIREMRRSIKALVNKHREARSFPDFDVDYSVEKDQMIFSQKTEWWASEDKTFVFPQFKPATMEEARKLAPKTDIYFLEEEFKTWVRRDISKFKLDRDSLAKTFLGFCKKKAVDLKVIL